MRGTCCKTTHRWIYSPLIDIPFRLSPPVNNLRALRSESDEIRFGKLNFNARASTIELRSMERTRHIMEREKVFLKASKIINEKETREREILGFEYSLLSKNDGGKFNPETVHSGFCSIGFSRSVFQIQGRNAAGHDTRGISTIPRGNVAHSCPAFTPGGLSRLGSSITLAIGRRSLSTCQW